MQMPIKATCGCTRSCQVRMMNQPTIHSQHSQVLEATAFKCGKQGTRVCMGKRVGKTHRLRASSGQPVAASYVFWNSGRHAFHGATEGVG